VISATVAIPDTIITLTPETRPVTVKPIVEKHQDGEQRVALGKAIDAAFASACEMYGCIEIPEGIPFEDLPQEEHDRCVRRGRLDAFSILEPILTWDAAVRMAELLAEAAWQIRARELATPPSAFKVRL
jgi:hypothetical protein